MIILGRKHRHLTVADEPHVEILSADDAVELARGAWVNARREQIALLADQYLLAQLHSPAQVTYVRLRQARTEAVKQLTHARAVVDSIEAAIAAFEATRPGGES